MEKLIFILVLIIAVLIVVLIKTTFWLKFAANDKAELSDLLKDLI